MDQGLKGLDSPSVTQVASFGVKKSDIGKVDIYALVPIKAKLPLVDVVLLKTEAIQKGITIGEVISSLLHAPKERP